MQESIRTDTLCHLGSTGAPEVMKRSFVCSATLYELIEATNGKQVARDFAKRWKIPSSQVTVKTQKEFYA